MKALTAVPSHLVKVYSIIVSLACCSAAQAAFTANLVVNGNLETGDLTGWTTTNDMEVLDDPGATTRGSAGLAPGASVGRYSFYGGIGDAIATATQTVSLFPFSVDIDSGTQDFALGVALQSRFAVGAADTARATFRFQDAGGNLLGSELSFVDPPTGAFDWTEFSQTGIVPVGTRQLFIEVDSRRTQFNSSDAYIDNVSFSLTSAIPEPSSFIVLGTMLCGSMFLRRRTA